MKLSAPQARCRRGSFRTLIDYYRCPPKLGDEAGPLWRRGFLRGRRDAFSTSGSICVAGVVVSGPSLMSAEALRRTGSDWRRCSLRCTYVRRSVEVCRHVGMHVCMYVCMYVLHSVDGFTSLFLITPVLQIVSEIHSNITSNTDKIQGNHFHNHFPALSFTTSFPFPLSFPLFFIFLF